MPSFLPPIRAAAYRLPLLSGWRRMTVAAVAGAVAALALAPLDLWPAVFIAVPVVVLLLDGAGRRRDGWRGGIRPAFAIGWAFGFGYFLAGLWWIGAAFLAGAENLVVLMPVAVVALPAGLALFWGAGAVLARLVWSPGWPRVVAFAAAMTLAEWLRGHLFSGFPWNSFGYTLAPSPLFMQSASLVGLWGLTALAFLAAAAPVLLLSIGPRRRPDRLAFLAVALLFGLHLGFGAVRLAGGPDEAVPDIRIRIVQPAIAQNEKWASGEEDAVLGRYLALSAQPRADGATPNLYVWPETAFPFFLTERPQALAAIADMLPAGATLLTGAARAEADPRAENGLRVYNSVYVIADDGTIRDAYDKVDLVPFGEFLPFERTLSALGLRQVVAIPGGFDAGMRRRTLVLPAAPPAGPLICYEIIFPGAAVEPGNRPGWLANVTNDGWFGDTPGPHQHLRQALMRAVEEGLPLVRAANTGISAVADPYGRILAQLPLGPAGALDAALPRALPPTVYARFGDAPFWAVWLLLSGLTIGTFIKTKTRD